MLSQLSMPVEQDSLLILHKEVGSGGTNVKYSKVLSNVNIIL